ncbi:hypothetical protein WMF18_38805 [Sorangium sp. So ce315]|uniref:hypothetical protein n=1 Tax=Sorangium sp. So ce315 TaxID=3133299 RepID=UPI003F620225
MNSLIGADGSAEEPPEPPEPLVAGALAPEPELTAAPEPPEPAPLSSPPEQAATTAHERSVGATSRCK